MPASPPKREPPGWRESLQTSVLCGPPRSDARRGSEYSAWRRRIPAPRGRYKSLHASIAEETLLGERLQPARVRLVRSPRTTHGRGPSRRRGKQRNYGTGSLWVESVSWEKGILPCLPDQVSPSVPL